VLEGDAAALAVTVAELAAVRAPAETAAETADEPEIASEGAADRIAS
jgi:hypothetical protein